MTKQVKERIGSSKKVCATSVLTEIIIADLWMTSVFDVGVIEGFKSRRLAVARTTQAISIFKYLHYERVDTHFLRREGEDSIRVIECQILDKEPLSGLALADHTNLELLFRIRASKKFCDRVERGEVPPEDISLPSGVELAPGVKFKKPFVEASTKWDDLDRYLTKEEAAKIANLTLQELEVLFDQTAHAGQLLDELFAGIDFILYDGKFEAARWRESGRFFFIDGTSADELGLHDLDDVPHDKNFLRDYYKQEEAEWCAALEEAQDRFPDDKSMWPQCPPLPEEMKEAHISHYQRVADLLKLGCDHDALVRY